jgi:hypothetical protein
MILLLIYTVNYIYKYIKENNEQYIKP